MPRTIRGDLKARTGLGTRREAVAAIWEESATPPLLRGLATFSGRRGKIGRLSFTPSAPGYPRIPAVSARPRSIMQFLALA
ncbi:hypothetical protein AnigIFM62618_003192 [Aspergillus niger]|nr:hypothetical protein AnigIFM62618_003192 [Aspergillus niger]